MNNSLHGSISSTDGTDDAFINDHPDGMENYVEDILFPMLDEGSLDHAILESLFYNEISLMNSSNSSTNEDIAPKDTLSNDTHSFLLPSVQPGLDSLQTTGSHDIDMSLLPNISHQHGNLTEPDPFRNVGVGQGNPTGLVGPNGTLYPPGGHAPTGMLGTSSQPSLKLQAQSSSPQRKLSVQLPKHTLVTGGGIRHNVLPVLDKNDTERTELPPVLLATEHTNTTTAATTISKVSSTTNPTSPSTAEEKKRQKLISQFATLAGRLGITLPPQVFQKLTGQAVADATPTTNAVTTMASVPDPIPVVSRPTATSTTPDDATNPHFAIESKITETANQQQPLVSPPQPVLLQQVQKSAVEAIAAVTSKRSLTPAGASTTTATTATDQVDSPMESNKPYSKKRKKPRLSDCELKLAELQSENVILKRHLDNICDRNARLDEDRMKAEQQMRQMLHDNAPDSILDPVVKNFTEMYSDYGRKRHDELNFHLQQLQRLANPTNFTKMGLWTLGGGVQSSSQSSSSSSSDNANGGNKVYGPNGSQGGSNNSRGSSNGSKNPIAGMLQRELGISAQQGRKILDQRQKIQNVCSNLKECLKLLAKLNQLCEKKTQMFHNRMTKCQQVLTPKQVVKLLIWIDDNSTTLGTVCPGWGSEQFQSKAATAKKAK